MWRYRYIPFIWALLLAAFAMPQLLSAPAEATVAKPSPAPTKQKPAPAKVRRTIVNMVTNRGLVVMELHDEDAPKTVKNFIKLVSKRFYDGLKFHRYEPEFVIQGGDPQGSGEGGPGYNIELEIGKLRHLKGTLGMARSEDPNSAGSQFYICLADKPHLDGKYATFGHVIKGMDVVMKLRKGDVMKKVTVVK